MSASLFALLRKTLDAFDPNQFCLLSDLVKKQSRNLHNTQRTGERTVDKDRIKGSAEQAKGAVKEAAGKLLGDKKLESEGKTEKVVGQVQNAIGGLKDTLRGK